MANRMSPSATASASTDVEAAGLVVPPVGANQTPQSGPFERWPRGADLALAGVVVALGWATMTMQFDDAGDRVSFLGFEAAPAVAYLLVAVAGGAVYWRRRSPVVVLVVAASAVTIYEAAGFQENLDVSTLVAIYTVGRHVEDDRLSSLVAAGALSAFLAGSVITGDPVGATAAGMVIVGFTWFVGKRLHLRVRRTVERERWRRAQARRAVAAERAHIARELHDVVAHRVSMMTVQSGAARTVVGRDPGAAAEAMAAVELEGRQALVELRHLLDVLRPTADVDLLGPQPGLGQIETLVDQHAENGMNVSLAANDLAVDLSGPVDLSAYRIVQEALTNVLKHAGPAANAEVRLSTEDDLLVIEVSDDGRGGTTVPGSGYGIIGMGERAQLLGGSLAAGAMPGRGFRVVARLPMGGNR